MRAWDLDGVICPDAPDWFWRVVTRLPPVVANLPVWTALAVMPLRRRPPAGEYIVTARLTRDRWLTGWWLRRHGVANPVVYRRSLGVPSAQYKARVLAALGVTVYVESCPRIRARLRQLLPDVEVLAP